MDFGVRKYRSLLFAATCGMGAEFLLALADTVVAGHVLGETALAGINLLQPVFNFVQFLSILVGVGAAIRFSLETGRFDLRRAREMFSQGLWSVLLFAGVFFVLFVIGREAFLGVFGASPEATEYARTYWVWYTPCALLLPMTLFLISLVYADGGILPCVFGYASLIGGNLVASYFLCRQMGIAGCALGTSIGNLLAIVSLSTHFLSKSNTLRLVRHFSWRDLALICKSSFAADASVSLCWALLFFLLNKLVVVEFGSGMLPVLSVVLVCVNLTQLFNGVAAAAQPIVGVYTGERNARGIRRVMAAAMQTALAEGLLLAGILLVWPQLAVQLVGIADPELVPIARTAVRIVALGFVAAPFVFLFNFYYLFVERFALAYALTFVADIVAYALLCPPGAHLLGATGLWLALGLAPVLAVAGFAVFLVVRYGWRRFPLLLSPTREANQFAFGFRVDARSVRIAAEDLGAALRDAGYGGFSAEAERIVRAVFGKVAEANAGRRVWAEAGVDVNDGVRLCLRDDGRIADLSSAANVPNGRHFVTMGYNRYLFDL